jgi:hypothetical protein
MFYIEFTQIPFNKKILIKLYPEAYVNVLYFENGKISDLFSYNVWKHSLILMRSEVKNLFFILMKYSAEPF